MVPTTEEDRKKSRGAAKEGKERGWNNTIDLKTCVVYYILQMSLFEVCGVNGLPLAFTVPPVPEE